MARQQYEVINKTRNTVVVEHLEMADWFWTRLKGLMFRPGLPHNHGLWIVPCSDIHAFFMRFEFDAFFINKQGEVVHLIERMKPWTISPWIRGSHVVLETNGGVAQATGTQIGDVLERLPKIA